MAVYYYVFLIAIISILAPSGSIIQASRNNVTTENNMSEIQAISNSDLSDPITQQIPKITVVASFFPIYELAKQVGGERVNVISLIPAGVEPHDYEPTIQQLRQAESAGVSPLEGIDKDEEDSGIGYLDKMEQNISNLKVGLECLT